MSAGAAAEALGGQQLAALLHLLRRPGQHAFRGHVHRAVGPGPGGASACTPDSKQQISHLTECPIFRVRFGVSFQPVSPYSSLDMKA